MAGTHVAETTGRKNEAYMGELAIKQAIDYTRIFIQSYIVCDNNKFDLLFDCASGKFKLVGWHDIEQRLDTNGTWVHEA